MAELVQKEKARRSKLSDEKPLAYEKIIKYPEREARGESCAIIDFCFDYVCNLRCKHCLATKITKKDRIMTLKDIEDIARQADEMGLAQFNISGGEPLIFKEIDELIKSLMPERFHISMSTNGMFLTEERAKELKKLGLDKIRISVDDIDAAKTAAQRNNSSQHKAALQALKNAKDAGLDAGVQHALTHPALREQGFIDLLEFATHYDYMVDVLPARALGEWEGRYDLLLDDADGDYLRQLHKTYPVLRWDMIPSYGKEEQSCGAVNRILHITKYGDVQPCVFIQISIGNIFEESLAKITERGFNIKHFKEDNFRCLSGQDRDFIMNYMGKCIGKEVPLDYKEVFGKDDFIDPKKEKMFNE